MRRRIRPLSANDKSQKKPRKPCLRRQGKRMVQRRRKRRLIPPPARLAICWKKSEPRFRRKNGPKSRADFAQNAKHYLYGVPKK